MAEAENDPTNELNQTSVTHADKQNGVDVVTEPHAPEVVAESKPASIDESERQEIRTIKENEDTLTNHRLNDGENNLPHEPSVMSPDTTTDSYDPTNEPEQPHTKGGQLKTPQQDQPPASEEQPNEVPEAPSTRDEQLAQDMRQRSDSRSTTATFATNRSSVVSSTVFIVTALDAIGASREARKSKELEDAVKNALANVKQSDRQPIDPEVLFYPLLLASRTLSIPLQVTALDCIGKLITYSYFAFPSTQEAKPSDADATAEQPPLIERAIDAICDCFENEATPIEIQQQIIKSLLAAVLNDKIVVHGAGLLKAVRQIYNMFIYSKSSQNQQIAQGSLTQMVSTVFDRLRVRLDLRELRIREGEKAQAGSSESVTIEPVVSPPSAEDDQASDVASVAPDQPVSKEPTEKLTLESFESNKDVTTVNDNVPTMVTRANINQKRTQSYSGASSEEKEAEDGSSNEDDVDEIYVKDAFLVFRALCKLSHKVLSHEQQQDLKSQNMRSKLLSLHLIHYLINNHVIIFTTPLLTLKNSSGNLEAMTFLQAIRPHLCLSLSRNGASSVPKVFEVCCEIFWLMLKHMRVMMKVRGF
jgi:brefeldin A-inhibited guanine nucleotide-exchange protein